MSPGARLEDMTGAFINDGGPAGVLSLKKLQLRKNVSFLEKTPLAKAMSD